VMKDNIKSVAGHFRLKGEPIGFGPVKRGHINDTYVLTTDEKGHTVRYILQRINRSVFKDPMSVMSNISRVTEHIKEKMRNMEPSLASRQLSVIDTKEGGGCHEDTDGNFWRAYNFIEHAVTRDVLESTEHAYESARMFGWFQRMLIDLPGPALYETITDFHNTPRRLEAFQQVLDADALNRAVDAKREIDFLLENTDLCNLLMKPAAKGGIPGRIAHNDAKINNVMLDERTDRGVCVIDLDTVMPGLSLYDFGDLVRTSVCAAAEDERDLSKVTVNISMFEALAQGYAVEAGRFLTSVEKKNLVSAGKLITFEQFIRFLTDYLAGDTYYKISRGEHNLDRSRTQMKLVESIIEREETMTSLVEKALA